MKKVGERGENRVSIATSVGSRVLAALVATVISVAIAGCRRSDGEQCYAHFESPDAGVWSRDQVLEFDPWPADSVNSAGSRYDMTVALRHTEELEMDTLWVELAVWTPGAAREKRDTVPLIVADAYGRYMGKGNRGLYTITDTVAKGITLSEGYHVAISHVMADDPVPGIKNVGIFLRRKDKR